MKRKGYPMRLEPAVKDYIWGGSNLLERWGKHGAGRIAECWEFSAFPKSESVVQNGAFRGRTLAELKDNFPDFFGDAAYAFPVFPLLIKLIDADGDLSIQVHPDDDYALLHENELGKTEMWYIAEAAEGASIYYGLKETVSKEVFKESIQNDTVCDLLNRIPVQAGDVFFVPAGTVHAILKGVTVIEVQESSSITYRIYDYARRDAKGNLRELHVQKAVEVTNLNATPLPDQTRIYQEAAGHARRVLAKTPYFNTDEVLVKGRYEIYNPESFVTFTVAEGEGTWENGGRIAKGDTFFVPADCRACIQSETLKLIETTL